MMGGRGSSGSGDSASEKSDRPKSTVAADVKPLKISKVRSGLYTTKIGGHKYSIDL